MDGHTDGWMKHFQCLWDGNVACTIAADGVGGGSVDGDDGIVNLFSRTRVFAG